MPPKGWKKYPDGFKQVNSAGTPVREKAHYTIEELLLPKSTVSRLAKGVLPEGSQIPKDGLLALLRSATVFISHLSAEANSGAHDACRKTVQPQDVFRALENIGLGSFVPQVKAEVERYEERNAAKRNKGAPEPDEGELSDDELKADGEGNGAASVETKKPRLEGGDETEVEESFHDADVTMDGGDKTEGEVDVTKDDQEQDADGDKDDEADEAEDDDAEDSEDAARVVDPVPENRELEGDRMSEDEPAADEDRDEDDDEEDEDDKWSARQK